FNEININELSHSLANLRTLPELALLSLWIVVYEQVINDQFYDSFACLVSNLNKLKVLRLGFINYQAFLKQKEITNCRNLEILNLYDDFGTVQINKRLAQKIKRLVKLNIDDQMSMDKE
ncbi:hypothetical protein ABPG73_022741, partial [Tetrahymena malaccensis]